MATSPEGATRCAGHGLGRRGFVLAASAAGIGLAGASHAAPRRGGTLVMTIIPEPSSMVSAFNTAAPLTVVSPKMIEGLVAYDSDLAPRPHLATSWTVAPDGRTVTFVLRQGVKWHDGQDFTSADVAFSLLDLLKKYHPRGRATFASLEAIDTPDAHTAILRLSRPAPAMMSALSGSESPILPKHIYGSGDPLTNPANNAPIGTGPFRFVAWQRGNSIVLERNPTYWDEGKPYLDRIVIKTYGDASARAAAFETGELQLASTTPVPLSEVDRFRRNKAFKVTDKGDELNNTIDFLGFNLRRPALGKVEVRHAVSAAINRDAMISSVWYGLATKLDSPVPPVVPQFHAPGLKPPVFDLKQANALLDQAGLPRGAGNMRCKLMLDLPMINDVYQREAEFLRQSLRQVGIDVEIRLSDVPSYIRRVFADYDFDLTLFPGSATNDPTIGLQRFYWSKAAAKGAPFVNAWNYSDPEMDSVLEAAAVEVDAVRRRALFVRFQEIAMRDLPLLPLALPSNITIAAAGLDDFMSGGEGIRDPLADAWFES
jgi:peptide/nickel transport system substrate-binding protein